MIRNLREKKGGLGLFRKSEEERDRYLYYDMFTGLGNLKLLQSTFEEVRVEERNGYVFVLFSFNRFHQMNSLFGLEITGDAIKRTAGLVKEFAEEHDGVAVRIQLDQMALFVTYQNQNGFVDALKRLLARMEQVYFVDSHVSYNYHFTFSYGIYFFSDAEKSLDDISMVVNMTGFAVRRLRNDSQTTGTIYDDENRPDWELHDIMMQDVEKAWRNREFCPYFQPLYTISESRAVGAEILSRWMHPTKGLIMPGDFIPVLERKGLIMDLDLYMLEEACKKIKGWIDNELMTVPIFVNLSKLNIHRKDFVERAIALVEQYDIPPVLINLELAEAIILYEKDDFFLGIAQRLHDHGFTLSMDNFAATDFSSINMLRDLPVDVVKVNQRFFHGGSTNERDKIFITNVLKMAKELKIKLIAEGVETINQAIEVREYGCEIAQGYYFSKPMSNEEFEKLIFY